MGAYEKATLLTYAAAAQRVRDSLDYLEGLGEPLDGWQSEILARAVAYLQTGTYGLGIDAGFRACRPDLYKTRAESIAFDGGPTVTVAEIRAELERLTEEKRTDGKSAG